MLEFEKQTQTTVYVPKGLEYSVEIRKDRGWMGAPWSVNVNGVIVSGARTKKDAFRIVQEMVDKGEIK